MLKLTYSFLYLLAEADLRHTAIWMSGIYLMLQMQFLENRVALELTRSEYVEAQEVDHRFYFPVFVFLPTSLCYRVNQVCLYSIVVPLRLTLAHIGCLP